MVIIDEPYANTGAKLVTTVYRVVERQARARV